MESAMTAACSRIFLNIYDCIQGGFMTNFRVNVSILNAVMQQRKQKRWLGTFLAGSVSGSSKIRLLLLLNIWQSYTPRDGTAEAEALTWDLFGWKRKQLNQTASASSYYIEYTVLYECCLYFQIVIKTRKYELNRTYDPSVKFLTKPQSNPTWDIIFSKLNLIFW